MTTILKWEILDNFVIFSFNHFLVLDLKKLFQQNEYETRSGSGIESD